MKKIYFLIFIFLIGPPAFRNISDNFNVSSGSIDIWVYLKIISYTLILIFLINENLKIKKDILFKKNNYNLINTLFLIIFIFFLISSFYGNNIYYNTGYSILFFSGFLIYRYLFNIFESSKDYKIIAIIKFINYVFTSLIIFTLLLSLYYPSMTGAILDGNYIRITGSKVSDLKVIPLITFVISLYLYLFDNIKIVSKELFFLLISILALYLGLTRSIVFVSLLIFILISVYYIFNRKIVETSSSKKYLIYFLILFGVFYSSQNILNDILTRNSTVSLFELSGRNVIWSQIFTEMESRFLGFGPGVAVKDIFSRFPYLILDDGKLLISNNIGSAHSFYLEFYLAGGLICLISILLIHLILLVKCLRFLKNLDLESIIIFTLFVSFSCILIFESLAFVPASNAFAFYWILILLIAIKDKKNT